MLEELTMEKKPSSRPVLTPAKGCGTELKKAQDTTSNATKQFARQSRRRETTGPKYEQSRKPGSQKQYKSANYDNRRTKQQRGHYYSCGVENTEVVDTLALDLVAPSAEIGGKKQNLNHLLNFHYARPEEANSWSSFHRRHAGSVYGGGFPSGGASYNSAKWLMSTHKHKYNKEQFLQANCQFVVRSDGDYSPYMADADTLVDWDLVEQIRVLSYEAVTCPICLDTPVAGKITRCGHVFCWPCMLHYLALSDRTWRKCPICYEAVHRKDLKSVLVLLRPTHTVGEQITFQLMKRERGSLIASPVSQYKERTAQNLLSIGEDKLDVTYSKLLTANADQALAVIEKELLELKTQLSENEGCPEMCFIEEAMELLSERKNALLARENNGNACNNNIIAASSITETDKVAGNVDNEEVVKSADVDTTRDNNNDQLAKCVDVASSESFTSACPVSPVEEGLENFVLESEVAAEKDQFEDGGGVFMYGERDARQERVRYVSASSNSEGEDGGVAHASTITAEDLEINCATNSSATKYFYFYQAVDGQQLFMHAVNINMLMMTYGTLENSPQLITGTILEKEAGTMTDELRKRLRYLQHLPVTCQFEVAEIDLQTPVISDDTFESFKDQVCARKKRREKKDREERRRERKVNERVQKQQYGGRVPSQRLPINSLHHFPECGSDNSPPSASFLGATAHETSYSTASLAGSDDRSASPVTVFRDGSPVHSSSGTGPSFAQMLRVGKSSGGGTWPSVAPRRQQPPIAHAPTSAYLYDSDTESNPIAAPHYRQSFSDAIATALEKAAITHDTEEVNNNGKKKKRKQKVLLFSTGMACNRK